MTPENSRDMNWSGKGSLQIFCRFFKKDLQQRMKQNEKTIKPIHSYKKINSSETTAFLLQTAQYNDVLKTA